MDQFGRKNERKWLSDNCMINALFLWVMTDQKSFKSWLCSQQLKVWAGKKLSCY